MSVSTSTAAPLHPLLTGAAEYPFVKLERRRREPAAGRHRDHQLRHGRSA